MKVVLTNDAEFSGYVDSANKGRVLSVLESQYVEFGESAEFQVPAGEGYSGDRVFGFEFLYEVNDELTLEFLGSAKG